MKTPEEARSLTIEELRLAYQELYRKYMKLKDLISDLKVKKKKC